MVSTGLAPLLTLKRTLKKYTASFNGNAVNMSESTFRKHGLSFAQIWNGNLACQIVIFHDLYIVFNKRLLNFLKYDSVFHD